jgi:hypothetical protein
MLAACTCPLTSRAINKPEKKPLHFSYLELEGQACVNNIDSFNCCLCKIYGQLMLKVLMPLTHLEKFGFGADDGENELAGKYDCRVMGEGAHAGGRRLGCVVEDLRTMFASACLYNRPCHHSTRC